MHERVLRYLVLSAVMGLVTVPAIARADGNLQKVKHIIIVMQENHSFDNYFGALAYDPDSPYHNGNGPCGSGDHSCVDGLTCTSDAGGLTCSNSNVDDDGGMVFAFHNTNRCVNPDPDHEWGGSHHEANFAHPNETLASPLNDGFVLQNDLISPPDDHAESSTEDQTMGFYTQDDIPFYYYLAEKFAIDDRYFAPVLGPTFPNRSYLMAATSFGHVSGDETVQYEIIPGTPPIFLTIPYKPITGTIFDLLDHFHVTWTDYYSDVPEAVSFLDQTALASVAKPVMSDFYDDAAAGTLPQVSFVESVQGFPCLGGSGVPPNCNMEATDEHPPTNIQRGQAFVYGVVDAMLKSPNWKDSIIFITYDEHGGFYDHVPPPRARQGHASSPDGIGPGQCADLSNPPVSEQLGRGANCNGLFVTDGSQAIAKDLCPQATTDQPFPADCANFDQYGFRVPFIAVSPFSKPHYVSHTVGDHTSILALIEKRFFRIGQDDGGDQQTFLTARDHHADTLEDLFDFNHSPSLNTPISTIGPPVNDCTP
jgi:phospholipase C